MCSGWGHICLRFLFKCKFSWSSFTYCSRKGNITKRNIDCLHVENIIFSIASQTRLPFHTLAAKCRNSAIWICRGRRLSSFTLLSLLTEWQFCLVLLALLFIVQLTSLSFWLSVRAAEEGVMLLFRPCVIMSTPKKIRCLFFLQGNFMQKGKTNNKCNECAWRICALLNILFQLGSCQSRTLLSQLSIKWALSCLCCC